MKKTIIALTLALSALSASALELGVSQVHDYNLAKNGIRVTGSMGSLGSFAPQASFTRVEKEYNRFGIGADYSLFKVGVLNVSASAAGVYQDSYKGDNGYGVTVGLKSTAELTKDISLVAGVERFIGEKKLNSFNGNVVTLGMNLKF